ncbi:PREDICTED: PAX-interacting protein 1-like [Drosophila arizonae]|uniref:PAX-interacting protein 1-like n=1 Tax=Drosophila arizonae TaxID=7263 RepID=A0ABM1PQE1_DROAR|nr:PREDICTED: PAX-interacting protein 1-like [Drosophila arizonae]
MNVTTVKEKDRNRSSSVERQTRQAVTRPRRAATPPPLQLTSRSELEQSSASDIFRLDSQEFSTTSRAALAREAQLLQLQQQQQQLMESSPWLPQWQLRSRPGQRRLTFEQWLLRKRSQESMRRRQSRREAQRVQQAKQLRQQMAQKSYAEWLTAKKKRLLLKESRFDEALAAEIATLQRQRQSQHSLQQWKQRKQQEAQQRRERQEQVQQEDEANEKLREQLSHLAWQRWISRQAIKAPPQLQAMQKLRQQQQLQPQQQPRRDRLRMSAAAAAAAAATAPRQRKQSHPITSLYLQVPLSVAQRSLRRRLQSLSSLEHSTRRLR